MKEYNKDGVSFKYKGFLSEDDFVTIINTYISVYNHGLTEEDNIEGFHKNSIMAEMSFNISIGNLCIENFDKDLHKVLFENGVYKFLEEDIINLKKAHDLAKEICNQIDSSSEVIYQFLNKIINLIPSEIDVKKLQETWQNVTGEYKQITEENK